jgi:hypothetical protein
MVVAAAGRAAATTGRDTAGSTASGEISPPSLDLQLLLRNTAGDEKSTNLALGELRGWHEETSVEAREADRWRRRRMRARKRTSYN